MGGMGNQMGNNGQMMISPEMKEMFQKMMGMNQGPGNMSGGGGSAGALKGGKGSW